MDGSTSKGKRKRGRKTKAAADNRSPSPDAPAAATASPAPAAGGRRGRKSRRLEAKADADASRQTSPPRRGEAKPVANGVDAAVAELGPAGWEEVGRVVPSMDAVVKVFCVHTEPNFSLPWQRKRQYSSSSSGFIIGGRRVLTNAHSVEHFTQVKLKKRGSDTKYLATVLAIGTECDIALLTVSDDEFWEEVSPVEFGSLPALQDAVTVVGYPIGGDTISVTSGVVSRIEVLSYVHGSTELLGLQIDAAINSGNSGGPAFNDRGICVGIAFQSLKHEDAENIGYVIPTPVIKHFIQDYEKSGAYTGFPIIGVEWQKMENPDLRKAMGMKPDQKGVRVRRVEPTAPESGCLQPSDIILSFDGIDIANDGTVPFRHGERIGFSYLVSQKYTGDTALIKVLRNSKIHEFKIKLATHKRLIAAHVKGRPPSYYIVAGFVFAAVSVPYLRSEDYIPTVFDNFSANVVADGTTVNLGLWDTAGQEDYNRLRPLSYRGADVFVLAFSLVSRASYENIMKKWIPELQHYAPGVPVVLVGTKLDLREDKHYLLDHPGMIPVTTSQGEELRKQVGALYYIECSSKTQQNVKAVFDAAIKVVIQPPTKLREKKKRKQRRGCSMMNVFGGRKMLCFKS